MKALKIFLGLLFGLVALILMGILALVLLVNPNDYKPQIEKMAADRGVELKFEGDLGWSFYPSLGVRSGKLLVKPAMKNLAKPIAFESMAVSIKLLPLFHKQVQMDQVRIHGGALNLQDASNGEITSVSNLDLLIKDFNLQQTPFTVELSLEMNRAKGNHITQNITLNSTLTLTLDQSMQQIQISKSHHDITFSGDAVNGQKVVIKAEFPADIDLAKKHATLKQLQLQVDSTHFTGQVESFFSNNPSLVVMLDGDAMDLDHYLATPPATKDNDVKSSGEKSMELIPAKTIQALPGDYALSFKQLTLNHLHTSDFAVKINITSEGLLAIQKMQANAYEGHFDLTGTVDARQPQPRVVMAMTMSPLQLEPALKDYLQLDHAFASGDFGFEAKVNTEGLTRGQLMQALDGEFSFDAQSITLNEVDLTGSLDASLLQLLQLKLPQLAAAENKTLMSNVHGVGVINHGVVNNTSLTAKALCTTFNGHGQFDLVSSAIDYHMGIVFPSTDTEKMCADINPRLRDTVWPIQCKGTLEAETRKLCGADSSQMNDILKKSLKKEVDKQLKKKLGVEGDAVKETLKGLFH